MASRKLAVVRRLKKVRPRKVVVGPGKVELVFGGRKVRFKIVANNARNHVGEWHRRKPIVFVDKHLKGLDRKSIAVHEAVEKHVAQKYELDVDSQAHAIAVKAEREWLKKKKGNWRSHQMKVYHDWKRHGRK